MQDHARKTPLYEWHCDHQANMAVFGGYSMPMWYASAKNEHLAVLTRAGLFDTCHMAVITLQGPDAFDLLQYCFTKDLSACCGPRQEPLTEGRCAYGAFLNDQGHVIDDAIVFMLAPADYMVVVNAGMGPTVAGHLIEHQATRLLTITDWTDQVGKIDLQGPLSVRILQSVLDQPDQVLANLTYFSFKGDFRLTESGLPPVTFRDGTTALVSRTGYTGEIGFEIFCPAHQVVQLWESLLSAGQPLGMVPCGLAARDSLRAGAVLPLSHQDIGPWPFIHHPWPFALPSAADQGAFTKQFIGDQALRQARNAPYTLPFAGYDARKVGTESAAVKTRDGRTIGKVLTCTTDMGIGRLDGVILSVSSPNLPSGWVPRGLCCGFIYVEQLLAPGTLVTLHDQRRTVEVEIVADIRPARSARQALKNFVTS
jgi:aminomethyltransferase